MSMPYRAICLTAAILILSTAWGGMHVVVQPLSAHASVWPPEQPALAPRDPMPPGDRSRSAESGSGPPGRLAPSGTILSPENIDQAAITSRFVHSPGVAALSFADQGHSLASIGSNHSVKLWDTGSGRILGSPIDRQERLYAVAFSPDGERLATAGPAGTIALWELPGGEIIARLPGHSTHLLRLAFSPEGTLLASAGDDNLVKLWDLERREEIRTLEGHITPVAALAFSPEASMLASGGIKYSTVIKVWDVETGEELRTLTGHRDNVQDLSFSPDGTILASAGADGTIRLWSTRDGRTVQQLAGQTAPVYGLAFSPGGELLASSGDNGDIRIWEVRTGEALRRLSGHQGDVFALAFSPDGSLLASGGLDEEVYLWGIPGSGSPAHVAQGGSATPVGDTPLSQPLAQSNNGLIAFSTYRDGESKIYTMTADGSGLSRVSTSRYRDTRPAWSPDGRRIAFVRRTTHSDHEIFVMNADGTEVTQLTNRPHSVESQPAWSPDGLRMAFISNERPTVNTLYGRFHVWIMDIDGTGLMLLTDIGGSNTSPAWSPDGTRIAFDSTRDGDHEIYAIDADGSNPVNLTRHPAHDTSPAWSPDGRRIAFVSDRDGTQEIYVMEADGSNQTRLTDRPGFEKSPAWSPDGLYLVFYARDPLNNTDIYRIRSDGSGLVRLTRDPDFDGFPAWQPRPLAALAQTDPIGGRHAVEAEPRASTWGAFGFDASTSDQVTDLKGLPIGDFYEQSFKLLMRRDAEWVTTEGLVQRLGGRNDRLTDISDAYVRETQELQAAILALLRSYDRSRLEPEEQISYDVYEWYLDDLVHQHRYMYHDYPVTHFTTGIQFQLIQFFTDIHPLQSRQDVEDYVARLYQVDDKFGGLIEGLQLRADAGVIVPRFIFPWLRHDIRGIAQGEPRRTPFYTRLEDSVAGVPGLSSAERQALLKEAEEAVRIAVIPAFAALDRALDRLEPVAPAEGGVAQLPDGPGYYAYALRHHTTTDMTADEIHQLGLTELDRIHTEMRGAFRELGYPENASIPELYARLARESGSVPGSRAAETYEAIIQEATQNLSSAFDIRPAADIVVRAGAQGDYYVAASIDGKRPGTFYARVDGANDLYAMPTLAYHETVPGHHLQIALAQESGLPLFRNVVLFTGYAEGWALYAEQLAYELGWYQDDPYANLGRLRDQAFRAARLVVDTGLHAKGWTFDEALAFMTENVGRDPGLLQFEVTRYITWPGQSTAYMVGMLKIMELRQRARERLGDKFDLKAFHRLVLTNGSMPLEVLERVVDDYIERELGR